MAAGDPYHDALALWVELLGGELLAAEAWATACTALDLDPARPLAWWDGIRWHVDVTLSRADSALFVVAGDLGVGRDGALARYLDIQEAQNDLLLVAVWLEFMARAADPGCADSTALHHQ